LLYSVPVYNTRHSPSRMLYSIYMFQSPRIRSAAVWFIAALALFVYGTLVLYNTAVPGVADILAIVSGFKKEYIYLAGFLGIFIESLYVVGSFFPGTTLVTLIAVTAQFSGNATLLVAVLFIFAGWLLAGLVNVYAARFFLKKVEVQDALVSDRIWLTWYPAFRAAHEVASVAEGMPVWRVIVSSIKVKAIMSALLFFGALLVSHIFDVSKMNNTEGVISVYALALVSASVGVWQLLHADDGENRQQTTQQEQGVAQ